MGRFVLLANTGGGRRHGSIHNIRCSIGKRRAIRNGKSLCVVLDGGNNRGNLGERLWRGEWSAFRSNFSGKRAIDFRGHALLYYFGHSYVVSTVFAHTATSHVAELRHISLSYVVNALVAAEMAVVEHPRLWDRFTPPLHATPIVVVAAL